MFVELEDQEVWEGETAVFLYKTPATVRTVDWTLNGRDLSAGDKCKLETAVGEHKLTILDCGQEDSGTVCVYALDSMPTAKLRVKGMWYCINK